jgi:micrococcal nuclease
MIRRWLRGLLKWLALAMLLVVVTFLVLRDFGLLPDDESTRPEAIPADAVQATLQRVFDGDTISVVLDGERETVRLIGIDTPETGGNFTEVECFGPEATAFLRSLLPNGSTVWLERDVSERDRFDRLLFFVWIEGDAGTAVLVNEAVVANGYAYAQLYEPDRGYAGLLAEAQESAMDQSLGMWSGCEMNVQIAGRGSHV